MNPGWHIFSMDHGEILPRIRELDDFRLEGEASRLVNLLAVPVKPSAAQIQSGSMMMLGPSEEYPRSPPDRTQSPLISLLPDELLLEIFHRLDYVSCFRLSLVSKRLWNIGWPFTRQKVTELMGPWAGARIICLCGYFLTSDFGLPDHFLTREEEERLIHHYRSGREPDFDLFLTREEKEQLINHYRSVLEPDSDDDSLGAENLLDFATGRFQQLYLKVDPQRMLLRPALMAVARPPFPPTLLEEAGHLPKSEFSQASSFAHGRNNPEYYPDTENWILRNLTTAEFVRGDKLFAAFDRSEPQQGPDLGYPGFGEAIMCRIRWSQDEICDSKCAVWAGHRLEIRIEKYHAFHSTGSWKDVTGEIVDEISADLDITTRMEKSKGIEDWEYGP